MWCFANDKVISANISSFLDVSPNLESPSGYQ